MPIRVQVGLSQKRGLPNYGSLGASCHLEIELSDEAIFHDPELLPRRLQEAYSICRLAIASELSATPHPAVAIVEAPPAADPTPQPPSPRVPLPVTESQIRALHAISRRRGLNLHTEVWRTHGVHRVDQLTRKQASQLIDELQPAAAS